MKNNWKMNSKYKNLTLISVIAFLVFLLWRSLSKQDKRKSILYDDQYDDIRENVVNHDEEGAGRFWHLIVWSTWQNVNDGCFLLLHVEIDFSFWIITGEEDQMCYDITRLRKPDSTFDRGYYYSSLSAKYKKGTVDQTVSGIWFANSDNHE